MAKSKGETVTIFSAYFYSSRLKRRVYAREYGLKAFKFEIPKEKFKPR